jgi:V/A-type H+-transporting ATPase subunit K
MLEAESGYGRFVGASALPSSQTIYGIVVTFALNGKGVAIESAPGLLAIGVLSGIALLMSAVKQGACCASAINVSKSKPEVFGLSVAPAAIVEGFAVFAFVFALVVSGGIPEAEEPETPAAEEATAEAVDHGEASPAPGATPTARTAISSNAGKPVHGETSVGIAPVRARVPQQRPLQQPGFVSASRAKVPHGASEHVGNGPEYPIHFWKQVGAPTFSRQSRLILTFSEVAS